MAPDWGYANDARREAATEGAAEPAGVGMADMVNACFVNTDIVGLIRWL